MRKITICIFFLGLGILNLSLSTCNAQGVSINTTGDAPNGSAALDVSSSTQGLLIPRMTTAERDAINAPVESLLIFNTTTRCYEGYNETESTWIAFGCIGCAPKAVTATATANPICVGSTLTLTGSATGATSWSWTGPNGFTSSVQSPTIASITAAGAGVYTLAASNSCASVSASTAAVTVNAPPTTANAGSDINPACGVTTATLAGNIPTTGTGAWSVVSGTATITTPSSSTSGATGIAVPSAATLRWTISNAPCAASSDDVVITTTACFTCSGTLTIAHTTTNGVAPVAKTVNYGIVNSSLTGTEKCWITQNLGATNEATSATDNSEASGGWYWQFNRKQGFKHDGTTRTPATTWDDTMDNLSTTWEASKDPCTIELGAGWRIPTLTEWTNADGASGGNWANRTDTYSSVLKLHQAGALHPLDGSLNSRGSEGYYWSTTEYSNHTNGNILLIQSSSSYMSLGGKHNGFSVRCLKD